MKTQTKPDVKLLGATLTEQIFQSLCKVETMNSKRFRKSQPRISLRLK